MRKKWSSERAVDHVSGVLMIRKKGYLARNIHGMCPLLSLKYVILEFLDERFLLRYRGSVTRCVLPESSGYSESAVCRD